MKVRISQGIFQGTQSDGVVSFKGVPYAAPPVGADRFAAPKPPVAHEGVADAREYGPTVSAPSQRSAVIDALLPDPVRAGENSLNLNIWTPDTTARMPVLVFIHGGGFVTGTGSTTAFDGTSFARNGVVAVTINYRLGVEGFLQIPGIVPNRGLLDQVAALEWIRDNIRAFGGDPDRVTISGESAGAMSVLTLLAVPRAKGLFRRAISQSGTGHHVHSPEVAAIVTAELCAELGIAETVDAINGVPLEALHAATNTVIGRLTSGQDPRFADFRRLAFQPVIDGDILPTHPVEAARSGSGSDVALLIGTNSDEYGLFVVPTGLASVMNDEMLTGAVSRLVADPTSMIAKYREHMPTAATADLFSAIQSDWFCVVPTTRYVEARAQGGSESAVYEFAWQPSTYDGQIGAVHTMEIPFVFDTLDDPWGRELRGEHAPQNLADEMHRAWVAFATTGNPGWASYGEARQVWRFDLDSALVEDPHSFGRKAWEGVL